MKKDETKIFDYVDSENVSHSVKLKDDDFKLVQVDKSIHDTKFKSKPTTFFRDALKRFAKNKASVAGAVILGILLLSSFLVPVIDTNPVDESRASENFLPPKLFPSGTGFWDGTKKYVDQVADENSIGKRGENKGKVLPAKINSSYSVVEFKEDYITNLTAPKEILTNSPSKFAKGGQFLLRASKVRHNPEIEDEQVIKNSYVYYISPVFSPKIEEDYKFELNYQQDFVDTILNYTPGEYRLELRYGEFDKFTPDVEIEDETVKKAIDINDETETEENDPAPSNNDTVLPLRKNSIILKDFSTENANISLKSAINNSGKEVTDADLVNSNLVLVAKPSFDKDYTVPVNTLKTSKIDKGSEVVQSAVSIENPATNLTYTTKDDLNYWTLFSLGNGSKALHQAKVKTVSFTYDSYMDTYLQNNDYIYSSKQVLKYVNQGLLPSDLFLYKKDDVNKENPIFNDAYLGFNFYKTKVGGKLYNQSPIIMIKDYDTNQGKPSDPITYNFEAEEITYLRLGYKEVPTFLFGTNQQGKDLFKIVFIGLRTSLILGICAASICFLFGLCYGAISGYFGGTVDLVMQRFTDVLSGIPWIVIMTLMIIKFEATFGVFLAALCLTGWIGTASLTRTQFYRFKGREYILASRTLGANDGRLIFRHILPNAMGTIITSSVLMIPSVIFSEATISYLGLGLKELDSLGVILSDNQKFLQDYPNLLILPAVVIALIMISFNLFGNGLRDAFNPSLKGSE